MKIQRTKITDWIILLTGIVLLSACARPVENERVTEKTSRYSKNRLSRQMPDIPLLKDCAECPQLSVVSPGVFRRDVSWHTNQTSPQLVSIPNSFAIGVAEVTVAEYQKYIKATDRKTPDETTGDNLPVTNVSWQDANAYTEWLTRKTGQRYRLPSEAEWEYAARGNTRGNYYWGDVWWLEDAQCGSCDTPWPDTGPAPVRSFAPNEFGLYDVAGNVYEWTQDCYHVHLRQAPVDGSAWIEENETDSSCDFRMIRGGSWRSSGSTMKHGSRLWFKQRSNSDDIGFRVVRDVDSQSAE